MTRLALGVLMVVAGCLDYEVQVETVIAKDGAAQRSVRIHERSDKHETWRRYAPPGKPYELSGEEAAGVSAKGTFLPGSHGGGLRVLRENIEGDYRGAAATEGQPFFEGQFEVGADAIEIGTLYRYVERIDLGIDLVRFRAGVEGALRLGADVLVTALELAEPHRDFAAVRRNANDKLVPEATRVLLAIHSQLLLMEQTGKPLVSLRTVDELKQSPHMAVIFAELERLGIRRHADAPETNDLETYFKPDAWTIRDTVWKNVLAPLDGVDEALRRKLWGDLFADDGKGEKSASEETAEGFWTVAIERVMPEDERPDSARKKLRDVALAGLGAPYVNDTSDSHGFDVVVRLPGSVLFTNGLVEERGLVAWRRNTGGGRLSNPSLYAYSFEPSDALVGRIADVPALLEFRDLLAAATAEERESVRKFLSRARESSLAAALKADGENKLVQALGRALAPTRE